MTNLRGRYTDEEWEALLKDSRNYKSNSISILTLSKEDREELRVFFETIKRTYYDFDDISPAPPSIDAAKKIANRLINKIKNKYGL